MPLNNLEKVVYRSSIPDEIRTLYKNSIIQRTNFLNFLTTAKTQTATLLGSVDLDLYDSATNPQGYEADFRADVVLFQTALDNMITAVQSVTLG